MVMEALRDAFSVEHALQCGYCTPGMLITARDIVVRLPDADDDRIRLELAGNLCRCTGYNGIVRAIRRVLDNRPAIAAPARAAIPAGRAISSPVASPTPSRVAAAAPAMQGLQQALRIGLPRDTVWKAVQDPALIASCVPGARLLSVENGRIRGEMSAALGPIRTRFAGEATVAYDTADHSGKIAGEGRDSASGTRLSAEVSFKVVAEGPEACLIELGVNYSLRGSLAQFGRGPIVQVFAREIAETVGRNLEARLRGEAVPVAERLGAGRLALRASLHWLRELRARILGIFGRSGRSR
jgi:carbon-monoxide dehydrogenase small subunit